MVCRVVVPVGMAAGWERAAVAQCLAGLTSRLAGAAKAALVRPCTAWWLGVLYKNFA